LAEWFGPNGFTVTTTAFDFRPGGSWQFVMHGPDGTDYPNHVLYREITRPERITYDHGEGPGDPSLFHTSVTLLEHAGRTQLTMRALFATAAARDHVVTDYHAIEGAQQTIGRLAAYLGD